MLNIIEKTKEYVDRPSGLVKTGFLVLIVTDYVKGQPITKRATKIGGETVTVRSLEDGGYEDVAIEDIKAISIWSFME